jgi:hypothetical protein
MATKKVSRVSKRRTPTDSSIGRGSAPSAGDDDALARLDDLIKMAGDSPEISRFQTGLPWMDWAIGGGWPCRIMAEVYGPPKSYKSTTVEYLAGRAAIAHTGNIVLLEYEHMERRQVQVNLLASGFRGEVYNVPATLENKQGEVVPMGDEERLRVFRTLLKSDGYGAGIVDPLGGFIPTAEEDEDSMDEAHQGLWARQAAKYSRIQVKELRVCEHPFNVFVVNHQYGRMGYGSDSPGDRWKHGCGIRITLHKWWRRPGKDKGQSGELPDGSWIVGAEVKDNKFGPTGREFSYVVKAGRGVHPGLSAAHACVCLDLAEVGKTGYISLGGKSYGTFNQMVKKWRDEEMFAPFFDVLEGWAENAKANDA